MGKFTEIVDVCLKKGLAFAAFRPMNQIHKQLIIQLNDKEKKEERGFMFHPFHESESHPTIIISPDIFVAENEADEKVLDTIPEVSQKSFRGQDLPYFSTKHEYENIVENAIQVIKSGELGKVIISRIKAQYQSSGKSISVLFHELCEIYPSAYVSLVHHPQAGTWLGASPEILLKGKSGTYKTVALAGTRKMENNNQEVIWREKELEEQSLVSDFVRNVLRENGAEIIEEKGPINHIAGKMAHLKTNFQFRFNGNILALTKALHPTPAVSGTPKKKAIEYILQHEKHARAYYCGFLGIVDEKGETELCVNLRCMQVFEKAFALYLGGGITSASRTEEEWEETCLKASTLERVIEHVEKITAGSQG